MLPSTAATVLTDAIDALASARTLERVTVIVADAARALADADGATFVLREDGVCFYADEKAIAPLWKGMRFPTDTCVSGWAMTHGETVLIPDILQDERVPLDAYRPTFVRSLCMMPVPAREPIAAIGAYWAHPHTPDDRTVRHLSVLAETAAVALENLELRGALSRRIAERDEAAERADELEAAVQSLVHDLRNPLGAMMGYADLIADATADDTVLRYAETIHRVGDRLSGQIDRLLAVFALTSRELAPETVDLSAVARRVCAEHCGRAPHVVLAEVQDGIRVLADPLLLEAVLDNVIGNAVKYSARAGTPRIRITADEPVDGFVEVSVADNGVGFAAADAALLFRPFTRLHSEDEFAGTGLGLASVARIVRQHGGSVAADGAPGEGATVRFRLPAAIPVLPQSDGDHALVA